MEESKAVPLAGETGIAQAAEGEEKEAPEKEEEEPDAAALSDDDDSECEAPSE